MFSIGDWMYDVFGPYGAWGILVFVFLIFFIDAVVFPTLPELFFIIAFMYDPTVPWGAAILCTAVVAEIVGIGLLYAVVERIRIPRRIKAVADRYVDFLVVSDERILLVNRVAPMIPFAGAFISLVDTWRLGRSMAYIVLGCVLKYGAIMLMSSSFYAFFSGSDAEMYTLLAVIAFIVLSMAASVLRKRKREVPA